MTFDRNGCKSTATIDVNWGLTEIMKLFISYFVTLTERSRDLSRKHTTLYG